MVHDNLGFTLLALNYPDAVGDVVCVGNTFRRKNDGSVNVERSGILHAKLLREVTEDEVRSLLTFSGARKNSKLHDGWWYEASAD